MRTHKKALPDYYNFDLNKHKTKMARVMPNLVGEEGVMQDVDVGEIATPPLDEEYGLSMKENQKSAKTRRRFAVCLWLALAVIILVFGLSVGLAKRNSKEKSSTETALTVANPKEPLQNPNDSAIPDNTGDEEENSEPVPDKSPDNLVIFDNAVALIKSSPHQYKELSNGEKISYREYNKDQPEKIVMLPGFMFDDTSFAILAVLPEFKDHHIIAVNPIGWHKTTMNEPIYSHEDNAEIVIELLNLLGIEEAMVAGYSTGGGIAFFMALNYPEIITTAFLLHSIPLHGDIFMDKDEREVVMEIDTPEGIEDVEDLVSDTFPDDMEAAELIKYWKDFSTNPSGFPPMTHKMTHYMYDAAMKMPGKGAALIANSRFNVTPLKTQYAEPSDALADLDSNIVVISSSRDYIYEDMKYVTQLAIADGWSPGTLSYYDDDEGQMALIDNPAALAKVYREAFEEQVKSGSEDV